MVKKTNKNEKEFNSNAVIIITTIKNPVNVRVKKFVKLKIFDNEFCLNYIVGFHINLDISN